MTVTAVAAGIALNISGCVDPKPFEHAVGIVPNSESACTEKTDPASGDVLLPEDETDELEGNIAAEEPSDDGEIFVIGEVPVEDSRDFAP